MLHRAKHQTVSILQIVMLSPTPSTPSVTPRHVVSNRKRDFDRTKGTPVSQDRLDDKLSATIFFETLV